jgi:hypothetical protein
MHMKRFAFAATTGSIRRALALTIAVVALAGTVALGRARLDNPGHYPGCRYSRTHTLALSVAPCTPPTRATWQIPLALLIAVGGLAAAVKANGDRPWSAAHDHCIPEHSPRRD